MLFLLLALVAAPDLGADKAALTATFAGEVEQLAVRADADGLAPQAAAARVWIKPRESWLLYSPRLPEAMRAPAPADTPAKVAAWDQAFWALRTKLADDLIALAKQAIRDKRASLAYECVLEAARQNPDHADARRLLGYKQFQGQWRTDFEIKQLRENKVWSAEFGWVRKDHLAKYQNGERFVGGKWISAEVDAQQHSDINDGWEVETDHFLITTNKSLEDGVKLGEQLEDLYRIWQHTFVRFYVSASDVSNLFAGRAASARKPVKHKVYYFRSKMEYIRHLQHSVPNDLSITAGFYNGDQATAYFFAGAEADPSTLVHEATHQLFSETNAEVHRKSSQNFFWLKKRANFWIVEGIACYMESLAEQEGGLWSLGGGKDARMQGALVRLFRDNYYVPLAELVELNMESLQTRKDIASLYGQSAAVVSFLMHHEGGKYRDALNEYLLAVYLGRDDAGTLSKLTGKKYEELDVEFKAYMGELLKRAK